MIFLDTFDPDFEREGFQLYEGEIKAASVAL